MKDFYLKHKIAVNKTAFIFILILGMYLVFNVIYTYVAPFIWGFLLSLALVPLVNFITSNTKINRNIAAIFSILLLLLALALIFNIVIRRVIVEGSEFFESLPFYIEYINNAASKLNNQINSALGGIAPTENREGLAGVLGDLSGSVVSSAVPALSTASTNIVARVPNALLSFILCIISSFFFTIDRDIMKEKLSLHLPSEVKRYTRVLYKSVIKGVLGYLRAQGILMSIVAVICTTGLMILDVRYAAFLGVIIAFVDALPVFGSGFFYWPWAIFSMIIEDYKRAVGLIVIYLTILLTRQILEPKILGGQIGLHPLITLMSIYVGLRLFGFFGIFIGPCIAVVVKAVYTAPAGE